MITVELKTGDTLRGFLFEAEDSMNMVLKKVTRTSNEGRVSKHDSMYVRGASIVFVVMPAILKNAPMFRRIAHWRAKGGAPPSNLNAVGGQAQAILRKAQERTGQGRGGGGGGPPRGGLPPGAMSMHQPRGPPMGYHRPPPQFPGQQMYGRGQPPMAPPGGAYGAGFNPPPPPPQR